MPRSPSTYSLPPGTTPQQPNTVISSSMFNAFADDVAQTFNTVQPIVYGGTGSNDLKLTDTDFGIKDNSDPTKIGQFNASGLPTGTTRTYDLPYYSGTLGLVSDIRGQIYGLTLSNGTDTANDINIASGSAVDNNGAASMLLAVGLVKQLDAVWAVGTNQGMRASGAAIADTTYHIFLIRRPDTGVVDIAADTSVTGANIAANTNAAYTQIRRIGSIVRTSGSILSFTQYGNDFRLVTPLSSIATTSLGTTGLLFASNSPTGLKLRINITGLYLSQSGTTQCYISDPDQADSVPSNTFVTVFAGTAQNVGYNGSWITNTSAQLRVRAGANTNNTFNATLIGWTDDRGQYQ